VIREGCAPGKLLGTSSYPPAHGLSQEPPRHKELRICKTKYHFASNSTPPHGPQELNQQSAGPAVAARAENTDNTKAAGEVQGANHVPPRPNHPPRGSVCAPRGDGLNHFTADRVSEQET
jgi:hypothetical protein